MEPFTQLQIEHILPDTPTAELRGKWATENPSAAYDDYKNRLGNLTLLEKPINIVAGNDFYSTKQTEYRKSGNYLTRSLVELTSVGQNTSNTRGHQPIRQCPIHRPAQRDAVQGKHILHQLLRAARFGVGEGNHRRIRRGKRRAMTAPGDADAGLAEPASTLGRTGEKQPTESGWLFFWQVVVMGGIEPPTYGL